MEYRPGREKNDFHYSYTLSLYTLHTQSNAECRIFISIEIILDYNFLVFLVHEREFFFSLFTTALRISSSLFPFIRMINGDNNVNGIVCVKLSGRLKQQTFPYLLNNYTFNSEHPDGFRM